MIIALAIFVACSTKRLIHEAEKVSWLYPTDYEKQAEAYKAAIARKNEMTAASRANMFNKLSSLPNVTIYTGMASFVSKDVVKVTLPDEVIELQGKKIFINTGSTSIIPAIDGLKDSKRVYTSTSLMELDVLPRHLIIVGGGYIGLEFASMYASFGSKVTVLEGGNKFIAREDRDIADAVKETLEKKGIEIRLNARVLPRNAKSARKRWRQRRNDNDNNTGGHYYCYCCSWNDGNPFYPIYDFSRREKSAGICTISWNSTSICRNRTSHYLLSQRCPVEQHTWAS